MDVTYQTLVRIWQDAILELRPTVLYRPLEFSLGRKGANRLSSTKDTLVVSETVGRKITRLVPFSMRQQYYINPRETSPKLWKEVSDLEALLKTQGWLKSNQELEFGHDGDVKIGHFLSPSLDVSLWETTKKLRARGFLDKDETLGVYTEPPAIPIWGKWAFAIWMIGLALTSTETLKVEWDWSNFLTAILSTLAIAIIIWLIYVLTRHFGRWKAGKNNPQSEVTFLPTYKSKK